MPRQAPKKSFRLPLRIIALSLLSLPGSGQADLVFDGSLGPAGSLTGTMVVPEAFGALGANGQNLFHSFEHLSVGVEESLHFQALSPSIQAIIARVTGLESTRIDGGLSADATLYLLNPQGMVVGPNARLDMASTLFLHQADTVNFAGGEEFRVRALDDSVALAVSPPTSVSFSPVRLDSTFTTAGAVSFNQDGLGAVPLSSGRIVGPNQFLSFSALSLYPGQRLQIQTAPGVERVIARVSGLEGSVFSGVLTATQPNPPTLSAVSLYLLNGSGISVAEGGAFQGVESLHLGVAENLRFSDGRLFGAAEGLSPTAPQAFLLGTETGALAMQGATLRFNEALSLTAPQISLIATRLEAPSLGLFAPGREGRSVLDDYFATAPVVGEGGEVLLLDVDLLTARPPVPESSTMPTELAIVGGQLVHVAASRLSTRSAGGSEGRLALQGETVAIDDSVLTASNRSQTGHPSRVTLQASGALTLTDSLLEANTTGAVAAGSVQLDAPTLTLRATEVRSESLGAATGDGGAIALSGEIVEVTANSLVTSASLTGQGDGGAVTLEASQRLIVNEGSRLGSSALGAGNGGRVRLEAPSVVLQGATLTSTSESLASQVLLLKDAVAALNEQFGLSLPVDSLAGFLEALTSLLEARTGLTLTATTPTGLVEALVEGLDGQALAELEANLPFSLDALGRLTLSPPPAGTVGAAGTIALAGETLSLEQVELNVASEASDPLAEPGRITLDATGEITLQGGLLQSTASGAGSAGRIRLTAPALTLAAASLSASAAQGATGAAGDILLQGTNITLAPGTRLSSETNDGGGDAGVLRLEATEQLFATGSTLVTTSRGAGNAGAITLNAPDITLEEATLSSVSQAVFGPAIGAAGLVSLNGQRIVLADSLLETVSSASQRERAGTISVEALARLDVVGSELRADAAALGDAGNVLLRAPLLTLENSTAQALSLNQAQGNAGRVGLFGDDIAVTGASRLSSKVFSDGGDGGGILVEASNALLFTGNAIVESSATGSGSAGIVGLFAPSLTLSGTTVASASSADVRRAGGPVGAAGAVRLAGATLSLDDVVLSTETAATTDGDPALIAVSGTDSLRLAGARLETSTLGAAPAGAIELAAPTLVIDGLEALAEARGASSGDAGNIALSSVDLKLTGGNVLTSRAVSTSGESNAGVLTLDAFSTMALSSTILSTSVRGPGAAGRIAISAPTLTAERLRVSSTSEINPDVAPFAGPAGRLLLSGNTISLSESRLATTTAGGAKATPAEIQVSATKALALTQTEVESSTQAAAEAGALTLEGAELALDGVSLVAESRQGATGAGGAITLRADGEMMLSGTLAGEASRLSTSSQGAGAAGDIQIEASQLTLGADAAIASESFGKGASGSIRLVLGQRLDMAPGSRVSTDARLAQGGDIFIQTLGSEIFLDSAAIQASAGALGNGGDLRLETTFFVLENALILAEADAGNGGKIDIFADAVVPDLFSRISADSNTGNAGTVNIEAPDIDLNAAISGQSTTPLAVPALDLSLCAPGGDGGLRLQRAPLRPLESLPGAPLGRSGGANWGVACGAKR
jgi:filamentous hemagglutinin family protein